ncbi:MAG: bifunctional phosphopantothenoylcysteine decarboxylase/phosphopantothenate--cysteine ligase CoaBC [Actinobacteria bacterium]|nr:MAG: bifunctional phosphopantothenoylcysteine decarboxylase/phosphopantothenate--cysteine ligase CoaBC [Actinomycetota bacterium]
MARLLLGVSGGIAAYKALELIRLATGAGHAVRVIQTPTSQRFVGAASFAALTGAPVLADEFERDPARGAFPDQLAPTHDPYSHLELVRNADVFLIAPASANTLARLAHGLADNLLCSAALAATCPVLVAPAMNNHMYEHPATQANLDRLRERGVGVVEPGTGRLASREEWGVGRLADPVELLAACEAVLAPGPEGGWWSGRRVLVSAGGTREPIDTVRYVGNRSSGRMGLALAEAAARRGAEVTVVCANVSLPRPPGIRYRDVGTAAELHEVCAREFARCHVLLMTAAVADFRPARPQGEKIRKADRGGLELALEPSIDVLCALAAERTDAQVLVGFAAEDGAQALEHAREKLRAKRLDAVVLNDVSRADIAFDAPDNEVLIVTEGGERHVPRASKPLVAEAILDAVADLRPRPAAAARP